MMDDDEKLVFETTLDAPPDKVWRALSIPGYLKRWLQPPADAEISVVATDENRSLTYRWRERNEDGTAQLADSLFTFEIEPCDGGGTWFRLTHVPIAISAAANSNEPVSVAMAMAA